MEEKSKTKVAVLASGNGTDLRAIIQAIEEGRLDAEVCLVLSNRRNAGVLHYTMEQGIPHQLIPRARGLRLGSTCTKPAATPAAGTAASAAAAVPVATGAASPASAPTTVVERASAAVAQRQQGPTREEVDRQIHRSLVTAGADLVILVGYDRILSPMFTRSWMGRCINVHPSLLPEGAGLFDLEVHRSILARGREVTGCTVHLAAEEVDAGAVVLQKRCRVEKGDTPETLKQRVQSLEGEALVEAVRMFQRGELPAG
ncbi:unnamed protein product [Discosporangium mesarthrocarpum]